MNALAMLRARLRSRTDSEHEQAIFRVVIAASVLVLVLLQHSTSGPLPTLLEAYLAIAIALSVCIVVWPAPSVTRRIIGMLADVGTITAGISLAGEFGTLMIGVYLFVTLGNGFRYGVGYLLVCGLLCVAGFIAVLNYVPYWQGHVTAGMGLMVALIIVPLYVGMLLRVFVRTKARVEQELGESLERERALRKRLEAEPH